jgi:uncharacterized protein (DUF488 family)
MLATIGYEQAELSDFIATLNSGGIEVLVDIRDRAQSRRQGFSKTALSDALATVGIEYIHFRELGDPKEGRDAARSGKTELFKKIFGEVLKSQAAQDALSQIEIMATSKRICLMCFERDHRKIVSDHLERSLNCRTEHLGVRHGAGRTATVRRMRHFDQGSAAQVEQVF